MNLHPLQSTLFQRIGDDQALNFAGAFPDTVYSQFSWFWHVPSLDK